jgi:hypothetical protein
MDIADQLMPKGPITHFMQKGKIVETYSADGSSTFDLPLVLHVTKAALLRLKYWRRAAGQQNCDRWSGQPPTARELPNSHRLYRRGQHEAFHVLFLTPIKTRSTISGSTGLHGSKFKYHEKLAEHLAEK